MKTHHLWVFALLLAAALPGPRTASAQMIPVADLRVMSAYAKCGSTVDGPYAKVPDPSYGFWSDNVGAQATPPDAGDANSGAFQDSQFFPSLFHASGGASGGWAIASGSYIAYSEGGFAFHVDSCVVWHLDAQILSGDPGSTGDIAFGPYPTSLRYHTTSAGHDTLSGRLSPGTYYVEGKSRAEGSAENMQGPGFIYNFSVARCSNPLIRRSPHDTTIVCGTTMKLTVVPTTTSGVTYQWRRNFSPLTNSTHIAGATTATLTINNPCTADAGWYDVVLTQGSIVEPSSPAEVLAPGTTDVTPVTSPTAEFSIGAAAPNPSSSSMSLRYTAARPVHVRASVHDAAGRLIRTLVDGMVAGTGTLSWDGRAASGASAPTGIYFLRVHAGGNDYVRTLVRAR